jgi:hypothetical protein
MSETRKIAAILVVQIKRLVPEGTAPSLSKRRRGRGFLEGHTWCGENQSWRALQRPASVPFPRRRALRRRSELAGSASSTRHPLFVVFRLSDFGLSDDQAHHRCCRSEVQDHCRLLREAASSKRTSAPLSACSIIRNRSASHLRAIVRARFTVS